MHPANSPDAPGGGLRIVSRGSILFRGKKYGPGDWFFVPNGVAYAFVTDTEVPTIVFYKYAFFGFEQGNRFSHPSAVGEDTILPAEEELMDLVGSSVARSDL